MSGLLRVVAIIAILAGLSVATAQLAQVWQTRPPEHLSLKSPLNDTSLAEGKGTTNLTMSKRSRGTS